MIHHIVVPSKPHVDWGVIWGLRNETLGTLISRCGSLPAYGWWQTHQLVDAYDSGESWGWYPVWNYDSCDTDRIGFWFRDKDQALYFKLLWG
jgi:hypothetical protein